MNQIVDINSNANTQAVNSVNTNSNVIKNNELPLYKKVVWNLLRRPYFMLKVWNIYFKKFTNKAKTQSYYRIFKNAKLWNGNVVLCAKWSINKWDDEIYDIIIQALKDIESWTLPIIKAELTDIDEICIDIQHSDNQLFDIAWNLVLFDDNKFYLYSIKKAYQYDSRFEVYSYGDLKICNGINDIKESINKLVFEKSISAEERYWSWADEVAASFPSNTAKNSIKVNNESNIDENVEVI